MLLFSVYPVSFMGALTWCFGLLPLNRVLFGGGGKLSRSSGVGAERPVGAPAVSFNMDQAVIAEFVQHGPHVGSPETEQLSQFAALGWAPTESRQDSYFVGGYVCRLPSIWIHPITWAGDNARNLCAGGDEHRSPNSGLGAQANHPQGA